MNDEEAEDLYRGLRESGRSHRAGRYLKNEDKARYGSKTHQIGFRLSDEEIDVWNRVHAHWGISFSGWVTYVMLRFIEYQQAEALPELSERVTAASKWVPPAPTPHSKHCQVMTHAHDNFMQYFPELPISRVVRWALLDEAVRVLAGPSRSTLAAVVPRQEVVSQPVSHATPLTGPYHGSEE